MTTRFMFTISLTLVCLTACARRGSPTRVVPTEHEQANRQHGDTNVRYYQFVFVSQAEPSKVAHYQELLRPLMEPYGGGLERVLEPVSIYAEGIDKPEVVNISYYSDRDAFTAFLGNASSHDLLQQRANSAKLASIEGPSVRGSITQGHVNDRLYVLEIARYGAEGAEGYQRYETEAEPVMELYGYHVERVISPDSASGFPFKPDIVKLAYFEPPDGMERVQQDPAHGRIETELYPAATAESIWLTARVQAKPSGP